LQFCPLLLYSLAENPDDLSGRNNKKDAAVSTWMVSILTHWPASLLEK